MAASLAPALSSRFLPGDTGTELIHDALPGYSPRDALSSPPSAPGDREFEYKAEKKKGVTVASLKVNAPAVYSKKVPTFSGAGPVKGSANLYLDEPDTITSVVISVRGLFLTGHSDRSDYVVFFDNSKTMWSKDANDPKKKLSGTHSWPFSVDIPEKIQFAPNPKGQATEHHTLQSFAERRIPTTVQYEIVMHVARGKLKTDYKINCIFGYIPVIRPPSFNALRAIAYQEGTPLLDPTIDVDGWIATKKVNVSGTLFNSHPVEVECQLFLSAPLVYTRGSVIPLYMRMESSSQHALDLLTTHKAVTARLRRVIHFCPPMQSLKNPENYRLGNDKREVVEAAWWSTPPPEQEIRNAEARAHVVFMNGELHLPADLVPSTSLPALNIEYIVRLRAFECPGFKLAKVEKSLLEHPVDIVTAFAPGPRPVRHAPPGSKSDRPLDVGPEIGIVSTGNDFL